MRNPWARAAENRLVGIILEGNRVVTGWHTHCSRSGWGQGLRTRIRKPGTNPRRSPGGALSWSDGMAVRGARLEFLVPDLRRSRLLPPGFVGLSLGRGRAQQCPEWAKLQCTNRGVDPGDLDRVLRRITSLESWVDEWESLGRAHEQGARDALALGRTADAVQRYLAASAAYGFAQYVLFIDIGRKRMLHESCV